MEVIIGIAAVIFFSGLVMIGTTALFDLFSIAMPVIAVVLLFFGIVFGLWISLRNTFVVYRDIYKTK